MPNETNKTSILETDEAQIPSPEQFPLNKGGEGVVDNPVIARSEATKQSQSNNVIPAKAGIQSNINGSCHPERSEGSQRIATREQ